MRGPETRWTWCQRLGIKEHTIHAAGAVALLIALTPGGVVRADGVTPTSAWMNLYGSQSTFAGLPIPVGTTVAVFDPQGTRCGQMIVTIPGHLSPLLPCYGDDPFTSPDEGPVQGERLYFTINGSPVVPQAVSRNLVPVPSETVVTWTNQDLVQVNLIVPPRPPVTMVLESAQLRLDWQPVGVDVAHYEVWRATTPYFAPGDDGAELQETVAPAGAASLSWFSEAGVGDPGLNYTYRVRSLSAFSQTVGISQAMAEFDFTLEQ